MKKPEKIVVCPKCGHTHLRIPSTYSDTFASLVGGTHYMVCENCGSEIIPILIDKEKLDKFKSNLLKTNYREKRTFSQKSTRATFVVFHFALLILFLFSLLYEDYVVAILTLIANIGIYIFNKKYYKKL